MFSTHTTEKCLKKPKTQKKREQFNSPVLTRPAGAADQQRRTLRPPAHGVVADVAHGENRFL